MWQPSASLAVLKKRAELLASIREFFAARAVLEVDVPVLGVSTVTDPHLQAIPAEVAGQRQFLQTSPEFYVKRLLAAGVGSCYYLGKAFRQDERGRRHRPEFTMLEWYRLGFDDRQLREEIIELIAAVGEDVVSRQRSYYDLFVEHLGVDPHAADAGQLAQLAAEKLDVHWSDTDKSTWLDLLFSHCIEPHLEQLVLVYDYPACQCALARTATDERGQLVAKRFEVFWNGMELANGYWELTDAKEQAARFQVDNQTRQQLGLPQVAADDQLLAALEAGLPDCAGVALGVDRLLMCLQGAATIDDVVPF
jgi:lysyl-tRNA synthetase class 2